MGFRLAVSGGAENISLDAVAYTHLDVYKRQAVKISKIFVILTIKFHTCFRKNTDKVYKSFRIKSILLYRWKIKTVYKQCVR